MKVFYSLVIVLLFLMLVPTISAISWNTVSTSFNIASANLTELGDVNASSPNNGQVIAWNATTTQWEAVNQTVAGGGGAGNGTIWQRIGNVILPFAFRDTLNITGDIIIDNNVSALRNPNNETRVYFEDGVFIVEG